MSETRTWQVSLTLEQAEVAAADATFEEAGALAVTTFELEPDGAWTVTALFDSEPETAALTAALAQTLEASTTLKLDVELVAEKDWVAETVRAFPPIAIGPFWVHGSHATPPDDDRMPLLIEAGIAFGSGEHATTEGCLLALEAMRDAGRTPANVLDMGCGSGILAIAAVKLFDCDALAVDIDAPSVAFAAEAAALNGTGDRVTAIAGDGYATPAVGERAPFDLILANILANPLIAMAPDLAAVLAPGGTAILSGLLVEQAPDVIAAHEAAGLTLARQDDLRGWATLVMTKPA